MDRVGASRGVSGGGEHGRVVNVAGAGRRTTAAVVEGWCEVAGMVGVFFFPVLTSRGVGRSRVHILFIVQRTKLLE